MSARYVDGDAAAEMLERRWFATYKRAEAMRAECEAMRQAMEQSQAAWLRAQSQLTELETLRDALGEQITCIDDQYPEPAPQFFHRLVMSAA